MSVLGIGIIIHYHIKSSIFFSFSIASRLKALFWAKPLSLILLHNLQGEFSILKQRCSTSNQRPNTIHISQQRCHDSQVINAWILHVQSTRHIISKISLLSKFWVKLALQSIYSSHQDSWQCVVQCSSLLPHIQQLNFPTTKHDRMSFPILFCISYQ